MAELWNSWKEIRKALAGKKTYIMITLSGVLGALTLAGYEIPPWVWPLLGALDLDAVKAAVDKWKDVDMGE